MHCLHWATPLWLSSPPEFRLFSPAELEVFEAPGRLAPRLYMSDPRPYVPEDRAPPLDALRGLDACSSARGFFSSTFIRCLPLLPLKNNGWQHTSKSKLTTKLDELIHILVLQITRISHWHQSTHSKLNLINITSIHHSVPIITKNHMVLRKLLNIFHSGETTVSSSVWRLLFSSACFWSHFLRF